MVEYFRHYVDASFDTLRSRQAETAWLASKVAVGPEADKLHAKFRPYDIPFDGKVPKPLFRAASCLILCAMQLPNASLYIFQKHA
jgi:hypothetical protein